MFTPDGRSLLIAYYGSGHVARVSAIDWSVVAFLPIGGAPRHVVVDGQGLFAYVSDMLRRRVFVISLPDTSVASVVAVGPNPNTVTLSPDGSLLFVSCRGPNNPDGYELRSPQNGTIRVVSTESRETVTMIEGGNQPTGLALSPDGRYLAFSNFQDNTVELYRIDARD